MISRRMTLAFIVATLVAGSITTTGADQSENAASIKAKVSANAKVKVMAGSWLATVSLSGFPPFKALMTFNADGCLMVSQAAIVPWPTSTGRAIFSTAHGEWYKVSNGEFAFAFVSLINDESATLIATSRVSGTIHVDGATGAISGTATAADFDPDGNVMFSLDASIQAEQIHAGS